MSKTKDLRAEHHARKQELIRKYGEELDEYAAAMVKQAHLEGLSLARPARGLNEAAAKALAIRTRILEAITVLLD